MEVISAIISSITGVFIGLFMIKFSSSISNFLADAPVLSHARDVNSPMTYKIIGYIIIISSVISLFL